MSDLPDAAREPSLEEQAFTFLSRHYVQRADARQKSMGLQYTEAETHDLAAQMAKFAAQAVAAERAKPAAPCEHHWIGGLDSLCICALCGINEADLPAECAKPAPLTASEYFERQGYDFGPDNLDIIRMLAEFAAQTVEAHIEAEKAALIAGRLKVTLTADGGGNIIQPLVIATIGLGDGQVVPLDNEVDVVAETEWKSHEYSDNRAAERTKPAASDLVEQVMKVYRDCITGLLPDGPSHQIAFYVHVKPVIAAALDEAREEGEIAMREQAARVCRNAARMLSGSTPRSEGMLDAYEKAAERIAALPTTPDGE